MSDVLKSVRETAADWKVSTRTIRRLIEAGELKALKVGAQVRIRQAEADRYLARQAKAAARSPVTPRR